MPELIGFGIPFARRLVEDHEPKISYVLNQRALHRVLNFTGRTIDDVVNNSIVKNEILGYYKLYKFINRRSEIRELERQWNAIGG
jgi:hypothetical protein